MTRDWLLASMGYDGRLASELSSDAQSQLRSVAAGWLAVLVLVAWPIGYLFWLTEHEAWLAAVTPVAVYALCLNLLRVAVAGGGAGLSFSLERVKNWRPGLVPPVFLFVMACLMAQPAQLLLFQQEHASAVETRRSELTVRQNAIDTRATTPTTAEFAASLADCEFVVYRLQLLWRNPSSAARFTALYALLVLVPVFWSRFVALEALRAYEQLRYRQVLGRAVELRAIAARDLHAALCQWPSYVANFGAEDWHTQANAERAHRALGAPRAVPRSQLVLRWRIWT